MALTEAEKTKMAVLQAQGNSKRKERSKEINEARAEKVSTQTQSQPQAPLKVSTPSTPSTLMDSAKGTKPQMETSAMTTETTDDVSDLDIIKKEYPFEVQLGITKAVHFKPWTGRTKKEFNKLISDTNDVEELNIDRTMKILIRDYIFEKDIYLSDIEYQYLLLRLRDESLSDECQFESMCPECNEMKTISAKTSEVYRFVPSQYPKEDSEIGVTYIDINSDSDFEKQVSEITDSKDYDGITTGTDIEVAMHIKKDQKTPLEILDMIDNTTLKNLTKMMENLRGTAPSLEMYKEDNCTNRECKMYGKSVKYYTDDIPDVFSELIG